MSAIPQVAERGGLNFPPIPPEFGGSLLFWENGNVLPSGVQAVLAPNLIYRFNGNLPPSSFLFPNNAPPGAVVGIKNGAASPFNIQLLGNGGNIETPTGDNITSPLNLQAVNNAFQLLMWKTDQGGPGATWWLIQRLNFAAPP